VNIPYQGHTRLLKINSADPLHPAALAGNAQLRSSALSPNAMTSIITFHFALASGFSFASGAVLLFMAKKHPRARLYKSWGYGFILLAVANVVYASRHVAPDLIAIVTGHAVLQSALLAFDAGARRLETGQSYRFDPFGWAVVGATIALVTWFTYFEPSLAARLVAVFSTSAMLVGRTAWRLSAHAWRIGNSLPANVLAGLWWLATAVLAVTVIATVAFNEQAQDASQAGPQLATLVTVQPLLMALVVGFALWTEVQALHRRRSARRQRRRAAIEAGRTAYQEQCARAIAQDAGAPLCVLLIDMDHQRRVSKLHGAVAADALLEWAGEALGQEIKQAGMVTRRDTDQFLVILPRTSLADARALAEDLRLRIAAGGCTVDGTAVKATVTIGIANLNTDRATPAALAAAAQVAVYKARSVGRNRVETADEALPAIDYAKL